MALDSGLAAAAHDSLDGIAEPSEALQFVGHDEAARSIVSAYRAGHLHHAIMLAGPRGIGKATLAFRVARHLAQHSDPATASELIPDPDPQSSVYRQVASQAHHSVLHITRPKGDSGTFKTRVTVDEIRRIGAFLSSRSFDGSWRTVIVDPADDMNRNAANALLKNLEEPPERTLFLIIAHQPSRLLPTIRSRCQTMRLRPLDDAQMVQALQPMEVTIPQDAAERGAWLGRARGSVRMAILLAEYGGNDIMQAIGEATGGRAFGLEAAHKLATALSGRSSDIGFTLYCDFLREGYADAARRAAETGQLAVAKRLADASGTFTDALNDTETYNLDRKQFVLASLADYHDAIHGAERRFAG